MTFIDDTAGFLAALDHQRSGPLIELRYRREPGMARCFIDATDLGQTARIVHALGAHTDVYVGVLARVRRKGGREDVADAWVAWADCDTADSTARLERFTPAPSIVVASGSPHGRHAYWLLDQPLRPGGIEDLNRRLAAALAADTSAVDAARILRVPRTANFKYRPHGVVQLERCDETRIPLGLLAAALPCTRRIRRARDPRPVNGDALRCIEPAHYIAVLLGTEIGRDRKVKCPWHEDRTPSLHAYPTPDRGWFCFGCRRGGSIYDLAGALWGLRTDGRDFLELRRRLRELFTAQ